MGNNNFIRISVYTDKDGIEEPLELMIDRASTTNLKLHQCFLCEEKKIFRIIYHYS